MKITIQREKLGDPGRALVNFDDGNVTVVADELAPDWIVTATQRRGIVGAQAVRRAILMAEIDDEPA